MEVGSMKNLVYNINWDKTPNYERREFKGINEYQHFGKEVGIVIDNGSYECRAGWSICERPNLIFRSLVAKPKVPTKTNSNAFFVGNEILSIEQGKIHKKSPFDKNIITHFSTQEHILDYIFSNLKINDSEINHPIIMSEPFCNIHWSRKNLTEMMFELYNVPSFCYGIDFQFSLLNNLKSLNKSSTKDLNTLIISSSYQTTHVVPILNGCINYDKSRRISIGGFQVLDLLTKSMHLRYPDLKNKFTNEIVQEIQHNYLTTAKNYRLQLKNLEKVFLKNQDKIKEEEKIRMFGSIKMYQSAMEEPNDSLNIKYKQLVPYRNIIDYNNQFYEDDNNIVNELVFLEWPKNPNEVILTEEDIKKKQELRKEQSKRLREIMQKKKEENIKNLEKELKDLENICLLKESSDKYQFEEALLSKGFNNFEAMQKRMNKILMKIHINKDKDDERFDEEKRWPLINVPDEDLIEDQLKMKRIQKMHRNAYITRLEKREIVKKERERVEEMKQKDPEKYLIGLYRKKKELFEKIENYKITRKEFQNRHSKVNQKRMYVLAELGKESERSRKNASPDEFGIKDEDWEIYRGISRHNLSEDEEEDNQQLNEVEAQIIEMDPNYFKNSETLLHNRGSYLFIGVDQFRGPELIFNPSIIGGDQMGLIELILSLLKTFSPQEQKALCNCIFITGGNTKYKYIEDRIRNELQNNLDCEMNINIHRADDPELDCWKGQRNFMNDKENSRYFMTKKEYYEYGPDYFKEHFCSNIKPNCNQNTNHNKNDYPNKRRKEI